MFKYVYMVCVPNEIVQSHHELNPYSYIQKKLLNYICVKLTDNSSFSFIRLSDFLEQSTKRNEKYNDQCTEQEKLERHSKNNTFP